MSGSSRRFSQRNLQRPASQPVTPVRRAQEGNLPRSSLSPSTPARFSQRSQAATRDEASNANDDFDVASSNPTLNFLVGLREIVLKQLLLDIEAAGGLLAPTFSLQHICNLKPDVYGPPGSQLRRQVQNKVHKLRKLKPFQYLSVLNFYRVASGALTRSFCPLDSAVLASTESLSEPVTPVRVQRRTVRNSSPSAERQHLVPFETPPRQQRSPHHRPNSAVRQLAMNTQRMFDDFDTNDVGKFNNDGLGIFYV